jgi:hypothetical protein
MHVRNQIKYNLEEIYKEKLVKINKKEMIKNWDGYIDITSKREDIIDKIVN